MTEQTKAMEIADSVIDAALFAQVPGGSQVWVWLPQQDAWTPAPVARKVMEIAIRAALIAYLPQPSELVDLIERLESHMGKQDPQILLADCREAALELRAQSAQIAKIQADGEKLAAALERSRQGWSNALELGLLPVQHQSTALGLQEAATQALTEWKDRA